MAEDEFGHVHAVIGVHFDRDAAARGVGHGHAARIDVDVDGYLVDGRVDDALVDGVDHDLVDDLVQAGIVGRGSALHSGAIGVQKIDRVLVRRFDAADVRVGPREDVLERGQFDVCGRHAPWKFSLALCNGKSQRRSPEGRGLVDRVHFFSIFDGRGDHASVRRGVRQQDALRKRVNFYVVVPECRETTIRR